MRWYRLLLRLLRPRLWRDHGHDLEALARDRLEGAERAGLLATFGVVVALALDAVGHPSRVWGGIVHDLRDAVRTLATGPGFAAGAILTIALAVGANAAIFGLVNAVLLEPLPVAEPSRVMSVLRTFTPPGQPGTPPVLLPVSFPNFRDLADGASSFEGLAAATFGQLNLASSGEPVQAAAQYVTTNYFEVLGLAPQRGRFFAAADGTDADASPVVVLSDGAWRRHWAADPAVIGGDIRLNGRAFRVVGVAPRGFTGLQTLTATDLWLPVGLYATLNPGPTANVVSERALRFFLATGRLRPGASIAEAQAELEARSNRLAEQHPDVNRGRGVRVMPAAHASLDPNQRALFERAGLVLMGAVALVLVIAAANLSNLLLVRARRHRRDRAVRVALGASRVRLVRQQLIESLVLAAAGGALGGALGWLAQRVIWRMRPPLLDQAVLDLSFDGRVALFTVAATVAAGLLCGLVPALQAARGDVAADLHGRGVDAGRGARVDARAMLVAAQVALCLVAVAAATAFAGSLRAARQIDPGFDYERLLVAGFDAGSQGRGQAATQAFFDEVVGSLASIPGVEGAALASAGPLGAGAAYRMFTDDGALGPDGSYITFNAVTPGYFEAMGLRLVAGRLFDAGDRQDAAAVMLINETLAARLWPGEAAIGRRIRVGPPIDIAPLIVGVVSDARYASLGEPPAPHVYYPLAQRFTGTVVAHVRSAAAAGPDASPTAPASLAPVVRERLRDLDPTLPVAEPRAVAMVIRESLWAPALAAWLLGLFGLAAAALAATGLYAVIAQTLAQRRQEIGVRLALGARPGAMAAFIVRKGLLPVGVGIGLGVAAAALVMPAMRGLLYGSGSTAAAIAPAVLLIVVTAALACAIPARRAMRVDPLAALRSE